LGGYTKIKVDMDAPEKFVEQQRFDEMCAKGGNMTMSQLNECQYGRATSTKIVRADRVKNESKNWVGTLTNISTDKDGDATVYINLDNRIKIRSTNVSSSSPMYEQLGKVEEGKKIILTGYFHVHKESLTKGYFLHTINLTERGSLTSPEFKFEISSITPTN
jgi:hypothetical protein